MGLTEDIRDDTAELVKECQPLRTSDPIHGVTFEHGRPIVAAGRYLFRVNPKTGHVIDELETFPAAGGLAHDGRFIWQHSGEAIQELEARTGFVVRSVVPALRDMTGLECLEGDLLVLHRTGHFFARVRVREHVASTEAAVVHDAEMREPLRGLAWSGGDLWSASGDALVRIDPASGRVLERLRLRGPGACDLAADGLGRFWCVDGHSGTLRLYASPPWAKDGPESPRHAQARPSSRVVEVTSREPSTDVSPRESPASVAGAIFTRILVPIDFSAASRRALATALVMQDRLQSDVHLLHVAGPGANDEFLAGVGAGSVPPAELAADARGRLQRFVEHLFPGRTSGIAFHAHAGADVVRGVERAVEEIQPTLVLLCGGERHTVFRSHLERITRGIAATMIVLGADPPTSA